MQNRTKILEEKNKQTQLSFLSRSLSGLHWFRELCQLLDTVPNIQVTELKTSEGSDYTMPVVRFASKPSKSEHVVMDYLRSDVTLGTRHKDGSLIANSTTKLTL